MFIQVINSETDKLANYGTTMSHEIRVRYLPGLKSNELTGAGKIYLQRDILPRLAQRHWEAGELSVFL